MNADLNLDSFKRLLDPIGRQFARYRLVLFLFVVGVIYIFLVLRIGSLSNVPPDPATLSSSTQALATPHIDPATVKKIQDLKDNNVNVQALFNQSRQNPFQE